MGLIPGGTNTTANQHRWSDKNNYVPCPFDNGRSDMLGCIMAVIPAKVHERLSKGLKKFQPILATAQSHDVVEANTSNIVKAILSNVFGYAEFTEITSEYLTKGTFCDLAVKLDDDPKPKLLIEVKAIGLPLKEAYTKQAVHYAADEGVTWVVLTNGAVWRIYEVIFGKPIAQEMICEFNLLEPTLKGRAQIESLFPLTKEGFKKGALRDLADMKRAASRYNLAAIILSDYFLGTIRGQLKKLVPMAKIEKVRIPGHADHDSGLMAITIPG